MNPSKKGWLEHLFRSDFLKYLHQPGDESLSVEKQLYQFLQPTGLMYGYISNVQGNTLLGKFSDIEKSKVIFTQGLFRVFQLFYINKPHQFDDLKGFCKELISFYYGIYPNIFNKQKDLTNLDEEELLKLAEKVIEQRIEIGYSNYDAFWSSFFQNSLLYLDIILFSVFNGTHDEKYVSDLKNDACGIVLKTIALAASADDVIEQEEKRLFKYFFNSASMKGSYKDVLNRILNDENGLYGIDFDQLKPYWIFRKYLLEVAILTVFSDKEVHDKEKEFLKILGMQLGLSGEEKEASFVAIESFVLENNDQVHYFKKEKMLSIVTKKLTISLKKILNRNMSKISNEIKESKELVTLLNHSRSRDLTSEEKEAVRTQLIDVLKCLPIFVIIALPGTFMTLPLLLKLLPDTAFPSSFQDNKLKIMKE